MRVLIAADERDARRLVRAPLGPAGYDLIEVENGGDALLLPQGTAPPPLAILGWLMPGMDGIEGPGRGAPGPPRKGGAHA